MVVIVDLRAFDHGGLGRCVTLFFRKAFRGFEKFRSRLGVFFDRSYPPLADQGLLNPGAMGVVAAESTVMVYAGAVLSLVCFAVMLWSRGRDRGGRVAARSGYSSCRD